MWTSLIKSGLALAVVVFGAQVLAWVLNPILAVANSGPNADAPSVVRVGSYFSVLSLDNLVLLGGLAVAVALIGGAVVERRRI